MHRSPECCEHAGDHHSAARLSRRDKRVRADRAALIIGCLRFRGPATLKEICHAVARGTNVVTVTPVARSS